MTSPSNCSSSTSRRRSLNGRVLSDFFPPSDTRKIVHRAPGLLPSNGILSAVVMDSLGEHFAIIETGRDSSVLFRREKVYLTRNWSAQAATIFPSSSRRRRSVG